MRPGSTQELLPAAPRQTEFETTDIMDVFFYFIRKLIKEFLVKAVLSSYCLKHGLPVS